MIWAPLAGKSQSRSPAERRIAVHRHAPPRHAQHRHRFPVPRLRTGPHPGQPYVVKPGKPLRRHAPLCPATLSNAKQCHATLRHRPPVTTKPAPILCFSTVQAVEVVGQLQTIGINVTAMKKGDIYTEEQVLDAWQILDPDGAKKYQDGEIKTGSFAATKVTSIIEKTRAELGLEPLVIKGHQYGIRVLKDSEAITYLNNQANSGLRKHRAKTAMMFTHINADKLSKHDRDQLETNQRRQSFIAAAAQGARAQSLKMQRKGLTLPDFKPSKD